MTTKSRSYYLLVLLFSLLCFNGAMAGTTGKLAGRVIDADTGDPLPGVNILIEGTSMGASADVNGEYYIINIPPGSYEIQAVYIGYTTRIVKNVQINIDRTTQVDFELSQTVLEESEAIVVEAQSEVIQKDMTGSLSTVSSSDIDDMPVQTINEVINLQAGVIEGDGGIHVRGGRAGETRFMVDGVSVTNLNGAQGIEVETDAVQEMQLISGTFNAEYGKAMSGIVNIITKEGGDEYSAQVQGIVGSYYSQSDIFGVMKSYGPGISAVTGKTVMIDQSDKPLSEIRPNYDIRGIVSGPVPFLGRDFNFFVSGRFTQNDGYLYGRRWFTPQGLPGDSALAPLRPQNSSSVQGKITWRPFPGFKMSYSAFYNYSRRDHNTSIVNRYVPDSGPMSLNRGLSQTLAINHAFSASTFMDFKLSRYDTERESYLYKDPTAMPGYFIRIYREVDGETVQEDVYYSTNAEKDAIVSNAKENGWSYEFIIDPKRSEGYIDPVLNSNPLSYSFRNRYVPPDFSFSRDQFWLAKLDLTSQVSRHHLVKGGVEVIYNTVQRKGFTLRPKTDSDGNQIEPYEPYVEDESSIWTNSYKRNPLEISAYVQDKMEFDQLIVNLGLRMDYFDPDYIKPVDPRDPDIYNPANPEWKGPNWDEDYYFSLKTAEEKRAYEEANSYTPDERRKLMHTRVKPKLQVSPRIGLAYPISEKGVIHLSYGHFFQMPDARYLYGDAGSIRPDYKLSVGSQQQLFGNADLNAERTVQYEIGLQSEVMPGFGLDVTLFYKDIRDWIGISPPVDTKHSQVTRYVQYENKDYANIRGVTLSFEARPTRNFTAMLDYTFQVAEGTYSSPNDAYAALLSNQEPAQKLIYMDYDRRHSVNSILTYRWEGWVTSLIGKFNTGFPYTPEKVAGSPQANYRGWRENIARRPNNSQVDLRVDKTLLTLGGMTHKVYLRVFNLFDQKSELQVFADTGTAAYTSYGTHNWVSYNPNRVGSLEHYLLNPTWYQPPREIQLGYIINF